MLRLVNSTNSLLLAISHGRCRSSLNIMGFTGLDDLCKDLLTHTAGQRDYTLMLVRANAVSSENETGETGLNEITYLKPDLIKH